jgi:hypothetical protein
MTGMVAMAALLSGCAPLEAYIAPTDANVAKLNYTSSNGVYGIYSFLTYDDADTCSGPKLISTNHPKYAAPRAPMETTVRAGRVTSLKYVIIEGMMTCEIPVSFFPRAGHAYLARSVSQGGRCSLTIDDVTDKGHPRPELSFVPRKRNSFDGKCVPLPDGGRSLAAQAKSLPQETAQMRRESAPSLNDFKDLLQNK